MGTRRRREGGGFTLIEVTLAIVIGVIMVAGAVLIYNQAKLSAGNSRAQAKVVSLQQLVEEFAAMNQGVYPESLDGLNALWKCKRPDDWNKSPWGGSIGRWFTVYSVGIGNYVDCGNLSPGGTAAHCMRNPITSDNGNLNGPNMEGGLMYDYYPLNETWGYVDMMTNNTVTIKGYAVYIYNQRGYAPNFVTGGKAN